MYHQPTSFIHSSILIGNWFHTYTKNIMFFILRASWYILYGMQGYYVYLLRVDPLIWNVKHFRCRFCICRIWHFSFISKFNFQMRKKIFLFVQSCTLETYLIFLPPLPSTNSGQIMVIFFLLLNIKVQN